LSRRRKVELTRREIEAVYAALVWVQAGGIEFFEAAGDARAQTELMKAIDRAVTRLEEA
jgi:ribonuclease HI